MITVEQTARLSFHTGSIYALAKGEDENTFLSAGSEGIVVRWSVLHPDRAVAIAKVDGQVFSILLHPEKQHLIIGTMSGGIHVIDLDQKKEIHYITFHEQSIFDLKIHGEELYAVSKDGSLSVWSTNDFKLARVITLSDMSLRCIDFHPLRPEAAIGSSDSRIYLVNLSQWKVEHLLEGPGNSVFSVKYAPGGSELIAGSRDAQLYVYDAENLQLKRQLKAHLYTINDLQFIFGNRFFATASRDKSIRIWNSESLELQKSLDQQKYNGHVNSVNKLLWLPSHNYLVSASDDRSIITWKINLE